MTDNIEAIRDQHDQMHGDSPEGTAHCEVCTLLAALDEAQKHPDPSCSWWSWDHAYSWDKTDCTCNKERDQLRAERNGLIEELSMRDMIDAGGIQDGE